MFTSVKHTFTKVSVWNVHPTADVHNEINAWRNLVTRLTRRPKILCDLKPSPPTCVRATSDSGTEMGGLFQDLESQYFVCHPPFSTATQARLVPFNNRHCNITINELDLGALLIHILPFTPWVVLLAHIHTYIDNTVSQVWLNKVRVSTTLIVGPILRNLAMAERRPR